MTGRRMARRAFVRMSALGLALPGLEVMWEARARAAPPKRVVFVFTPGGCEALRRPGAAPTVVNGALQMGPVLAPLLPHAADLVVLENVDNEAAFQSTEHRPDGAGHASGAIVFTGRRIRKGGPFSDGDGYAVSVPGRSLDHVLGDRLGVSTKWKSLQLQVGPQPFERAGDLGSHVSWFGDNQWAPNEWRPETLFEKLFSNVKPGPTDDAAAAKARRRRRTVLDVTRAGYDELASKLGKEDRGRIEAHLQTLRELEREATTAAPAAAACAPPAAPAAIAQTDDDVPVIARSFFHQIAAAFSCDLTRVVSLQFSRTTSRATFPFLGITTKGWYHDWQHAQLYGELSKVHGFYAAQVADLLTTLAKTPDGAGSLLDSTLVVWAPELGDSASHAERGQTWILAGRAGGALRTGRLLSLSRPASYHNNVLLSVLRALDQPDTSIGDAEFCTGIIPGLI